MWQNRPEPRPTQHAPSWPIGPQSVLVHSVFGPWKTPPCATQLVCVVTKQSPLRQHAPVTGCGQVVPVQSVPAPCQFPPCDVQLVCDVTKQKPLGEQHAPVWPPPHVVPVQVVPLP